MLNDLQQKKKTIAIVGLGYVGLPVALAFARQFRVIGYDINPATGLRPVGAWLPAQG